MHQLQKEYLDATTIWDTDCYNEQQRHSPSYKHEKSKWRLEKNKAIGSEIKFSDKSQFKNFFTEVEEKWLNSLRI